MRTGAAGVLFGVSGQGAERQNASDSVGIAYARANREAPTSPRRSQHHARDGRVRQGHRRRRMRNGGDVAKAIDCGGPTHVWSDRS